MYLKLTGYTDEVRAGLNALLPEIGAEESEGGITMEVLKCPGGLAMGFDGRAGSIHYERKHQFFRALGLFVEMARNGNPFEIRETQRFDTIGAMFDCSRNAVMKPETIRYFIRRMALMGLNLMLLYLEDTYEVPGEPYFGYLRGRYTFDELKACDDYAALFGIELAPCVQTLAHLSTFLRWQAAEPLCDTGEILLADSEPTYAFIEELLKAASAPFRSRRIHIGMDEAHMLGLGRYLRLNGYAKPFDIMERHISRVREITGKLNLKPMMWSDMFFRLNNDGGYYNPALSLPVDTVRRVPSGITQVYWDYYHHDEAFYTHYIREHKRFGHTPAFAGGICTWTGAQVQNYEKTISATRPALAACKKESVREVFAAIWNDNGGECNYLSTLNGLQLWAELGWSDELDMAALKARTAFCCGTGYDALKDLCALDRVNGGEHALEPQNPSKYLLWQDPLLGLFDAHVEDGSMLEAHYAALRRKLRRHSSHGGLPEELRALFEQVQELAAALEMKCTLGNRLRAAYQSGDRQALEGLARKTMPQLASHIRRLRALHMRNWLALYKPFGWEVLDIRYGGLLARIGSAEERIKDYCAEKIPAIEELEEEKLPFDGRAPGRGGWLGHFNEYRRMVTPGELG